MTMWTRQRQRRRRHGVIRSSLRSLLTIDQTSVSFVAPLRTASIMMVEMGLIGIGSPKSTAFRLGALYVGLSDPGTSLSRRVRYMGLTTVFVVAFGALMSGLTWRWQNQSPNPSLGGAVATVVVSFAMALLTGLSPLLGSPALFQAMKLGLALFAVQSGVQSSTGGYGGDLGFGIRWTFWGAFASLVLAVLPEIIGNRDAVRTDLFKSMRGFGMSLRHWGKGWGTMTQLSVQPIPTVTLSISATKHRISRDDTETPVAKEWLLQMMGGVDTIRIAGLCLTNSLDTLAGAGTCSASKHDDICREADVFLRKLGQSLKHISFALHFPWIVRYTPYLRGRARRGIQSVGEAATTLINAGCDGEEGGNSWLSSIVRLIQSEVQVISELACEKKAWPPYSSPMSLPRRIRAAFPSSCCPTLNQDPDWAIYGFSIRLATAFALAMIPEVMLDGLESAHWFPMTVALIMVPKKTATHEKVIHRVIGTLFGLALGAAMVPLFSFEPVLIILLGLTTYASVLFIVANYALFTFFITGWVYVTVIGAGGSSLASTTLYRCCWTLAAGALVMIVMLTHRPKTNDDLGSLLADFARLLLKFADALLKQRVEGGTAESMASAKAKIDEIRGSLVRARINMLAHINEAALSPSEGYSVDPYSLAPWLAADLTTAVVVLQTVYLIPDGSADDLLLDIDQPTLSELERLGNRLQSQGCIDSLTLGNKSSAIEAHATSEGRGPFSNAIACAHRRLRETGVGDSSM